MLICKSLVGSWAKVNQPSANVGNLGIKRYAAESHTLRAPGKGGRAASQCKRNDKPSGPGSGMVTWPRLQADVAMRGIGFITHKTAGNVGNLLVIPGS